MFSLGKIGIYWDLFKEGKEVANVAFWKGIQGKGQPVLAALLVTIFGMLKGTDYEIPMDDATAFKLAGGIFFVTNWILTTITSKRAGFKLPLSASSVPAGDQPSQQEVLHESESAQAASPVQDSTTDSDNPVQSRFSEDIVARAKAWRDQQSRAGVAGNEDYKH